MIEEAYVSFETAKLLRDKGFPQDPYMCNTAYTMRGKLSNNAKSFISPSSIIELTRCYAIAPTQQMAMRWLRKVHHIHICPEYKAFFQERPRKVYYHWCNKIVGIERHFKQGIQDLYKLDSDYFYFHDCKTYHDSYEDACMECIKFALENLLEDED